MWAASTVTVTRINEGKIVLNDGVGDLSAAASINYLRYPHTAFAQRFLSEPERANGFTKKTTQEAIEEALATAQKPVYPVQASYNGNANIGRYLEIFPGEDSLTAPLLIPNASKILDITIQAAAVSTGAIDIKNLTTNTVLYSAAYNGFDHNEYLGLSIMGIAAGNDLGFVVSGSSVNKPKIRIWVKTL